MTELKHLVETEIIAFHDFFVAWLTGKAEGQALDREMADRLAPGFTIVAPSGAVMSRDELLSAFASFHGAKPNIRIKVRDVVIHHHLTGHVIASYTEWQRAGDSQNGRQSTVVMTDRAPFRWLSVHESGLSPEMHPRGAFEF